MRKAISLLTARLSICPHFAADALSPLAEIPADHRVFKPRQSLVEARSRVETLFLIKEGWACSHTQLADGSMQIINFLLPGELVGVEAITFPTARIAVTAITPVNVMAFSPAALAGLLDKHPALTRQLLMLVTSDLMTLAERLADFGRRGAHQRTLRFLLELWARLTQVGLGRPDGFPFPVTQTLLADAVGLTEVHLNRVLRRLHEEGLLTVEHRPARYVRIPNRDVALKAASLDDRFFGLRPLRPKSTL